MPSPTRRLPPLAILCAALVAAAAFAATARESAENEWTRSHPLAPGGRLEIVNVNGAIDAEPAAGEKLELSARRIATARSQESAQELLASIELREEVREGVVRVEVGSTMGMGKGGTEVQWTVRIPKGVAVDLRTHNGSIALDGLDAPVRAATVNGPVWAERLTTGAIDASSVNGPVEVSLAAPLESGGVVALETVNGRVSLVLPPESHADVSVEVGNGSVDTNGAALEFTKKSRTAVEATLNGGGASVTLETLNGAARISTRS